MMKKKKFKIWRVCSGVLFLFFCMLLSLAAQSGARCLRVAVIFRVRNQIDCVYSNSNLNLKNESMAPS